MTPASSNLDVALPAEYAADRRRDLALREDPGRELIEQRLEQMVVGAVYERHLDRSAAQESRREQPAEAAADDHYPWRGLSHEATPSGASPLGDQAADRTGIG